MIINKKHKKENNIEIMLRLENKFNFFILIILSLNLSCSRLYRKNTPFWQNRKEYSYLIFQYILTFQMDG